MSPVKDPSAYGPDWPRISIATKERAGWQCECEGQCGVDHGGRCELRQGQTPPRRRRPVILTVHHVNQVPWDHRDENLLALCEGCHLRLDQPMHQAHARETREAAKGLQPVFEVTP